MDTAVDVEVADPEMILSSEKQDFKEGGAEQTISFDMGKKAEVTADDDTSDEDISSQVLPGATHVCPPGLATRIDKYISNQIIPKLHKALTQKV